MTVEARINGWLARAATGVSVLLGIVLVVAVVTNIVNVVARYVFNSPVEGSDEVEIYLMIAIAFFGALVAHTRGRHLRMDVLATRFPPRFGRVVKAAEALTAVGVCGLVTSVSFNYTSRIWRLGSHSDNAHIPMWIPHSLVTVSFALMTLVSVVRVFVPPPVLSAEPETGAAEPGHPELAT